ncbi:MAG: hypothetical protein COA94_09120 [Rickettsiales bacterium]|nr:MAG: hypothetical protein COA94_09120 [Rickettsiales bacterium]
MQYLGGKSRIAGAIVASINALTETGRPFYDVFCGGLSITVAAAATRSGSVLANDRCAPLITLYSRWAQGWRPARSIGYLDYKQLQAKQDPLDPRTALAGFGLSFGGKWFAGYARNKSGRDYYSSAVRVLSDKIKVCGGGVKFTCLDYSVIRVAPGSVVYLDPPYAGTTGYGYHKGFSRARFLEWVTSVQNSGSDVFLSEYESPGDGWTCVEEFPLVHGRLATRPERLYHLPR